MRVLFVTTEMDDFVRVGGLAAVSAALPRALRSLSDVRILLPGYKEVVEQFTHLEVVGHCPALAEMPACKLGLDHASILLTSVPGFVGSREEMTYDIK